MEAEAEYISKVANSSINLIGIIVLVIGIAELNHLKTKQENLNTSDLDMLLLKFTSFFSFVYMTFTIITGCFCSHVKDFPNEVHLINGVCEMFQIFLQLVMNLEKVSSNQYFTKLGLFFAVFHIKFKTKRMGWRCDSQFKRNHAWTPNHDFPLSVQSCPMDRFYF